MDGTPNWIRREAGVRTRRKLGLADTGMSGRKLTMTVTSAKKVVNTSCASCQVIMPINIESSIRLGTAVIHSQLSPMGEA